MRTLLFGSSGFVGSEVGRALHTMGHEVIPVRSFATEDTDYVADLADFDAVSRLVANAQPQAVINCAGAVVQGRLLPSFATYSEHIVRAVGLHVPQLVGSVVITGSAGVYGEPERFPVHEDDRLAPNTAYTTAKYAEEQVARLAGDKYGVPVVIARGFNFIGPGLPERLMLPQVIASINRFRSGVTQQLHLPVNQLYGERDFLSVTEGAQAIAQLAIAQSLDHTLYNIGSGIKTSNERLLQLVLEEYGYIDYCVAKHVPQKQPSASEITPYASQADITRITTQLGWQPTGLEGLRKAIQSIRELVM